MTAKRILLLPNTNTFSHLAQALALAGWLEADGWQCHIGCARARLAWAGRHCERCHEIKELWEHSGIPFPCVGWFSDPARVEQCLRSQEQLICALRPAAVIGIFDFLSHASARGLPRISINGYCMLPVYDGVLGFDDRDCPERHRQQCTLDRFWRFAARTINPSLEQRGLMPVGRATEMFVGHCNLIYEIPEVCGAATLPASYHWIGPIFWDGWDKLGEPPPVLGNAHPTILLSAGSVPFPDPTFLQRLIRQLLDRGACVWVNSGDGGPREISGRVFCQPFLSPTEAVRRADLVVCRGGVGACYQDLRHAVPSLVLPTQPEQATNGLQLQRLGCGRVIAPPIVFTGGIREYPTAIDNRTVDVTLQEMLSNIDSYRSQLQRISHDLRGYDARSFISRLMGDLA